MLHSSTHTVMTMMKIDEMDDLCGEASHSLLMGFIS